MNGLADKGWGQEGGKSYFCSFLFWRSWGIKECHKGLWTDLMRGKERDRENVKKSHIFFLSQLSVSSGNSVLCLSSFSLGARSRQHTTFVTWGKIKRKTTGGRGPVAEEVDFYLAEVTSGGANNLGGNEFLQDHLRGKHSPRVWVKRMCYSQS